MSDNWDNDAAHDFMGGGGAPAVKFEAPGDTVTGATGAGANEPPDPAGAGRVEGTTATG